jgi:hypothetical protein
MAYATTESRNQFLRYFQELIQDMEECEDWNSAMRCAWRQKGRVPQPAVPLQLLLGRGDGYQLRLEPELTVRADGTFEHSGNFLLFDPSTFFEGISGFLRLTPESPSPSGAMIRCSAGCWTTPSWSPTATCA